MEGWEGNRVVSSLIWMPSEHSEVMVWLLVGVRAHGNAYGDVDIMFIREGLTYHSQQQQQVESLCTRARASPSRPRGFAGGP